jgi:hypothetical protein
MPKSGEPWEPESLLQSPWLAPFEPLLATWCGRAVWPSSADYTALFEAQRCLRSPDEPTLQFVPTAPKSSRRSRRAAVDVEATYDGRIALRREVPCLSQSYHDLFNAVAWAAFPRTKRALHARQYRALLERLPAGVQRLPASRNREQDSLTLFDEGGSVLIASAAPATPIAQGAGCFELDPCWRVIVFGHAVMEHAARGCSKVRSAALVLPAPPSCLEGVALLDWIDRALLERVVDLAAFQTPPPLAIEIADARPLRAYWTHHQA